MRETRTPWNREQKKLEAWRFWNTAADYAREIGRNDAISRCHPDVASKAGLTWREIDRATKNLRAVIGIGGRAWEPLPAEAAS